MSGEERCRCDGAVAIRRHGAYVLRVTLRRSAPCSSCRSHAATTAAPRYARVRGRAVTDGEAVRQAAQRCAFSADVAHGRARCGRTRAAAAAIVTVIVGARPAAHGDGHAPIADVWVQRRELRQLVEVRDAQRVRGRRHGEPLAHSPRNAHTVLIGRAAYRRAQRDGGALNERRRRYGRRGAYTDARTQRCRSTHPRPSSSMSTSDVLVAWLSTNAASRICTSTSEVRGRWCLSTSGPPSPHDARPCQRRIGGEHTHLLQERARIGLHVVARAQARADAVREAEAR